MKKQYTEYEVLTVAVAHVIVAGIRGGGRRAILSDPKNERQKTCFLTRTENRAMWGLICDEIVNELGGFHAKVYRWY